VANAIRKGKSTPIIRNVYPILGSTEVLTLAYSAIKKNTGATTPGTQNQTAKSFSQERLDSIRQRLLKGTIEFPDVRKKWFPKPGLGSEAF